MVFTFTEAQKFNKWWHYALVALSFVIVIIFVVNKGIFKETSDDFISVNEITLFSIATILIYIVWFINLTLKTTIDNFGIEVNFSGIPFCKRNIEWTDIQSISVVKYSPIFDYGGWGVRYSMIGKGWCYNVSGKYGIEIIYKSGKRFLIGTQQHTEAETSINHYFKEYSV